MTGVHESCHSDAGAGMTQISLCRLLGIMQREAIGVLEGMSRQDLARFFLMRGDGRVPEAVAALGSAEPPIQRRVPIASGSIKAA